MVLHAKRVKRGDYMPNEKYTFNFTEKEVKAFLKQVTNHKKGLVQQICWIIIFFGLIFLAYLSSFVFYILQVAFICILVIYCLLLILSYYRTKKILKEGRNQIMGNTYIYEFFDDYMLVAILDETSARTIQIKYTDITKVKNLKNHFAIFYANQHYFLRKSDLIENAKIKEL